MNLVPLGVQKQTSFWTSKSIDFDTFLRPQKRYLKMTFFGHRNEPKMGKKNTKKNIVYSSVL